MSITVKKKPMIKWYGKLFYGAGNLGYGLVAQTVSTFIMIFGTVAYGLPGTLMGVAVGLGTLWDAVTDPLVGSLSDRWNAQLLGRRHGFLLAGTFGMAIINIFLWNAPAMSNFGTFVWFALFLIALETFNTFFATPYTALGIELSGDYHEQTVIQSYKSVFFLLGLIVPTLLMAVLQAGHSPTDVTPYREMAYLCSTLALIFGAICFFGTYSHLPRLKAKARLSGAGIGHNKKTIRRIIKEFFLTLKSKHYRAIVLGYAISLMAAAFLTGVGFHMFLYSFRVTTTQMYLLMGTLFVMTIVFQPLWVFLSDKLGKKKALLIGMGLTAVGAVYVGVVFCLRGAILPNTSMLIGVLLPALALVGIGTGSMYSLPISMLADAVAYETVNSEESKTGTYSGFMTLAYKASQAGALIIIGILLDVIRFDADLYKGPGGEILYDKIPASVDWGLGLIVVLGVLVALVGGMIAYSGYHLRREDIPAHDLVASPEFKVDSLPREVVHEHPEEGGEPGPDRASLERISLMLHRDEQEDEKSDKDNGES